MKLIFCLEITIKVTCKVILPLWTSKFPASWFCRFWWTWSNILKVLKVTSLQYLYNISKKKLGMEFIFCMQINIKVSTSWHYHFWKKWRDMSKVPKLGSWSNFGNCNKKYWLNLFFAYVEENKNLCFLRSLVIDYFKVISILSGGMGVKKRF